MTIRKTLTNIVLAGALTLGGVGCSSNKSETATAVTTIDTTLYGTPLSASQNSMEYFGAFAAVFDIGGKKVLAYHYGGGSLNHVEAEALVLSEILDGDNEEVEISGKYVNDRFELSTLKANGYQINF